MYSLDRFLLERSVRKLFEIKNDYQLIRVKCILVMTPYNTSSSKSRMFS